MGILFYAPLDLKRIADLPEKGGLSYIYYTITQLVYQKFQFFGVNRNGEYLINGLHQKVVLFGVC